MFFIMSSNLTKFWIYFAKQEKDHTYISNIGSDPKSVTHGIGTALMEKVMLQEEENSKKNKRAFVIKLHVSKNNVKAIRFYKNLGFKEEGEDQHGIKMIATQLPAKFNSKIIHSLAPKPRTALIIRNADGMQYDDLKIALEGLEPHEQAPAEFNTLVSLTRSKNALNAQQIQQALVLFRLEKVRDHLYETIKAKTGNQVIYHLNGVEDDGRDNPDNIAFIIKKLETITSTNFDLFYLGGGHGYSVNGSSNLNLQQLQNITDTLSKNGIHCSAVVLGSCFSTAYLGLYQPLLTKQGVTISNSLECGGDNNFKPAMEWIQGKQKEFYSTEYLRDSVPVTLELRTALAQVLGQSAPQDDALHKKYEEFLAQYRQTIQEQIPGLSENEIVENANTLFDTELENFITDVLVDSLQKDKIQGVLKKYPKLDKHISDIVKIKGEKAIFESLINCLKPLPSSLVVGSASTLKMFNFSQAEQGPMNADQGFQNNYSLVRDRVKKSGAFEQIDEVQNDCNGVLVKKEFNALFAQATTIASSKENRVYVDAVAEGYKDANNHETRKKYDINYLLDSYLNQRTAVVDSSGTTKEYFYGSFFSHFQKSYTQKKDAVSALKKALNGEQIDLSGHLSTLRNGTLGKELREFIKLGMGNGIVGTEVNTVSSFVQALQVKCSNAP